MTGNIALSIGKSKMKNDRDFILAYKHNYRVYEPLNADPALKAQNEELISLNGKNYLQAYQTHMAETEQYRNSAPRKNAVRGFEVIQSFSRSELDRIDMEKWKADNIAWLKRTFNKNPEKYGENVISAVFHADEAGNPHIHAMIIPIDGKGHLNYSAYVDGPQNMRELYDDYAKFMKQEHGLERGTKYSVARHEDVKRFYTNVNKAVATEAPELLPGETA